MEVRIAEKGQGGVWHSLAHENAHLLSMSFHSLGLSSNLLQVTKKNS